LTHILLVDAHGVVLAGTTGSAEFGQQLATTDPFIAQAVAAPRALQDPPWPARPRRVSVPMQTGVRWATLIGTLDEDKMQAQLVDKRQRLVVSALAISSLGLLVLLALLSIEVLAPMAEIAAMARKMAAGDLTARAKARGAAELQVLASTLNDAARRLAGTHEALQSEVQRQTAELTKSYEQLAEANERLERLALTDPLTGLFNRRYLDQALALEIVRQRRQKRPFSLLMIDVDNFKHYNDTHGHPKGDEVLRQLAKILTGNVRASDVVCRVGGEEFVVVLLDVETPVAMAAAEKVRQAVMEHPFPEGDKQPLGSVTISAGVASWPKHGEMADDVISSADKALYSSKAAGRNRVTAAPEPPA
jgi:diguanylate cyclase (GGDEF)-like protein